MVAELTKMIAEKNVRPETNALGNTYATRHCPACEGSRATSRGEKNGFELLLCRTCSTLYTRTLPPEDAHAYDNYYTKANLSIPEFIDRRLDEIVSEFASHRQNNRLLDIGCGAGNLLKAAERVGWEAEGVEVASSAVQYLHTIGLQAFCGQLSEAAFPTAYFDVVTASELIEHVPDPSPLVAEIARVLRPGGILWTTTPHSNGLSGRLLGQKWSTVCPPEHLQLFSVRGASRLLARHGFRHVRIKTEGVNPAELLKAFRPRPQPVSETQETEGSQRVHSGYRLNEALLKNARGRMLKAAVNAALRAGRLGDSLKIWAER
jgi:SAM-dependent methyltransferase